MRFVSANCLCTMYDSSNLPYLEVSISDLLLGPDMNFCICPRKGDTLADQSRENTESK